MIHTCILHVLLEATRVPIIILIIALIYFSVYLGASVIGGGQGAEPLLARGIPGLKVVEQIINYRKQFSVSV